MTDAVPGQPLIELERVNKWFGSVHVLRDVDLTVERGEVVVVIGPSGSGKSTLCRAMNRLEPINSGTIRFDGQLVEQAAPAEFFANPRSERARDFLSKVLTH